MSEQAILVLDEGTTSTRAMVFSPEGRLLASEQRALTQYYPRDGWVEHDAAEIWERTLACALAVIERVGGVARIAAVGITNQRETVVAWHRETGEPLCRAIVWQDRRTADHCARLRQEGLEEEVQARTGLLLDPYFSATKMRWMLDNEPAVATAASDGTLAFGTVESWLVFKLTGGREHVTDASNASRTLLLALDGADWDARLCSIFGIPRDCLPRITDNYGTFGHGGILGAPVPICGLAGDQQSATIGQACLSPGEVKATYGTGAFVLANMGKSIPRSTHRLLGTVLYQEDGRRTYALEGSVFVAGSLIQWLRDSLGVLGSSAESEALARSVADNGGVVVVPALTGLGAPHWMPDARGIVSGLSFATGRAHLARAALEAMAHQTHDLASAFAADGAPWKDLRIDGGMVANDWMAQDIADILALPVFRPDFRETTALGAAMLAATGAGLHPSLRHAAEAMVGEGRQFAPDMEPHVRARRLEDWAEALDRV